jgi:hypothetical protein
MLPTPATESDLTGTIAELRRAIFLRKPILAQIIQKLGQKTLMEYVRGYRENDCHPLFQSRRGEFLRSFRDEVTDTLGPDTAESASRQLETLFFASTNDHHGPLNAHDFFNAHVATALDALAENISPLKHVITLSCGSVSLNNIAFPRGFTFHAQGKEGIARKRLAFLPSNSHACSVYGFRPYSLREVEKIKKVVRQEIREGGIPRDMGEMCDELIATIFGDPSVLGAETYAAQVTKINARIWERVFAPLPGAPSLVYIEQESFVARLLLDYHLERPSMINRLIFGADADVLLQKYFDGIYGSFSSKEGTGTYLFWALPPGHTLRVQLRREGRYLASPDGTYRIELTPAAIREALIRHELMPNIFLCFALLTFTYGLKCLGGYSQVNYLTYYKDAFVRLHRDLGNSEEADACDRTSSKNWSGFMFTFVGNGGSPLLPATFLDLLFHASPEMWQTLNHQVKTVTLEEAVRPMFPEIYRYSYPERERSPYLVAVTESDIARAFNMQPFVHIESTPRQEGILRKVAATSIADTITSPRMAKGYLVHSARS